MSVSDATASEPGSNTGKFRITRTPTTNTAMTIQYTITGTATNGVDYTSLSGSVTLSAGASSASILVIPLDDTTSEGTETVQMTLASDPAYQIATGSGKVSILDNE
jgi:hypothetical protein